MAFNVQTFRTRALTAAVFVIVMVAGLFINQWTFFLLFSIIHFGCWIEYQRLLALIDPGYRAITAFHRYGIMLAGWCLLLYLGNESLSIFTIRLQALGWWTGLIFVFILPINELLFAKDIQLKNIGYSVFGLAYISLSLGLMMDLYVPSDNVYSFPWFFPCVIIASIWVNDTMAYIIGSLFGRHPLSAISPKKTWEGTIGGILLSIGLAVLFAYVVFQLRPVGIHLIIIAAIAAIAGTFGDLLESKLKRMANVKDSGSMMPGHGGFLDRFDSLLLAIPAVWVYVKLVHG